MIVKIPKPSSKPRKSRPVNALLQHQVERLREIEMRHLIPLHRSGSEIDPAKMTEGEAAEYIRKMTATLHRVVKAGYDKEGKKKSGVSAKSRDRRSRVKKTQARSSARSRSKKNNRKIGKKK